MKFGFALTDYKIHSVKIYRGILLTCGTVYFSIFIAEIFVDFRVTNIDILAPISIVSMFSLFLSFKYPNSNVLRSAISVIIYLSIEYHFLVKPEMFHMLLFWFPIIPLVALIIQGIKVSQIWVLIIVVNHIFNSYYLKYTVGDSYDLTVYRLPFFVGGLIFMVAILTSSFLLYSLLGDAFNKMKLKNSELEELKSRVEEKKNLLEKYQQNIIRLAKNENVFNQGQDHLFMYLCKTAVNTLKVTRMSIWLFEDNNNKLVRRCIYELNNESIKKVELYRDDFFDCFEAIEVQPYIMASDARKHSETMAFTEGYLKPLNIYSLLDCPIIVDGKSIGVMCCEQKNEMRQWSIEDLLFIQSLTDFIATNYKNERIKNLMDEIKQKNTVLSDQNNKIETLNGELSLWNENLERIVTERTNELETRNTQLTEYAFINSHLLREPLSRILGLSTILAQEATSINDTELLDALTSSTKEMDSIIRKISEVLKEGHHFTREDIKAIIERNFS